MKMTTDKAIETGANAVDKLRNEAQDLRDQIGNPRQGIRAIIATQLDDMADAIERLIELAKGTA